MTTDCDVMFKIMKENYAPNTNVKSLKKTQEKAAKTQETKENSETK